MKIGIIGIGKLGLCFGLNLKKAGHEVYGVDKDSEYIEKLKQGTFNSTEDYVNEYLTKYGFNYSVNIGSDEMVTINQLADIAMEIAGKKLFKKHIDGPLGVRGRNSDNKLFKEKMGWVSDKKLFDGMVETYKWINKQVKK